MREYEFNIAPVTRMFINEYMENSHIDCPIYEAKIKLYNNGETGVMLRKRQPWNQNFGSEIGYPSIDSMLSEWTVLDRRILIEKTGFKI